MSIYLLYITKEIIIIVIIIQVYYKAKLNACTLIIGG